MTLRLLVVLVAVHILMGCGGPLSWRNATPLHYAAHRGDTQAIEAALAAGADPNAAVLVRGWRLNYFTPVSYARETTPLDLALEAKHADAVRVLMLHGARLELAWVPRVISDGEGMMRALLDGGYQSNTSLPESSFPGGTALHWAARCENPGVARMLLDAGADPNARDANGRTPLMAFWRPGYSRGSSRGSEVARLLLAAGADPVAEAKPMLTYPGVKRGVHRQTALTSAQDERRRDIEEVILGACAERGIQAR